MQHCLFLADGNSLEDKPGWVLAQLCGGSFPTLLSMPRRKWPESSSQVVPINAASSMQLSGFGSNHRRLIAMVSRFSREFCGFPSQTGKAAALHRPAPHTVIHRMSCTSHHTRCYCLMLYSRRSLASPLSLTGAARQHGTHTCTLGQPVVSGRIYFPHQPVNLD